MKKAIVLLSGGLDSATILYMAKADGFRPHGLIFDYGQRHNKEIDHARRIAREAKCAYEVVTFRLPWQGSSLLDKRKKLPVRKTIKPTEIPSTYVPARNIIFLSFAMSYAEAVKAEAVYIGANAIDYSGYPDCRPDFMRAYESAARKGMKAGVQGRSIKIHAPLIKMTKADIIRAGMELGVPYQHTWSCYRGLKRSCGTCDSCVLRAKGFAAAGYADPTLEAS
ncbi:MAG: 7-cyano-7-deazaguanine synthase QueC [Candidatus Omnitrophica bacterium]|nr:7-cyano-7-deazaguanine synthase QueC [Candidatus Omnitrophota bacterium]MCB9719511.1 7-cyano-7-deazaguanine synthase QueC [Candidatus Omnitrophota bacterium]